MPRLTKIYTRTGDDGTTGLAGGERVRKDSARIEAMGDVDELNSLISLIRSLPGEAQGIDEMLESIQHRLFDIGGELAMPGYEFAKPEWTERIENWLDQLNADLPTLKEFILPGGSHRGAACHQARAVCRRAERALIHLTDTDTINYHSLIYLNRLSDLLFVIARTLVLRDGGDEVTWQKGIE